jgi:hypothetical protein
MKSSIKNMTRFGLVSAILLSLVACSTTGAVEPSNGTADPSGTRPTTQTDAGTDVENVSLTDCPEAAPGAYQLTNAARGICLLYPDNFEVFEYGDGIGYNLVIPSLMPNHESPVIWLTFEPANGRSLEEVTAQRLNDYAFQYGFPDSQAQAITLGSEPASMLDNLPGQDTNRRIVTIHDDQVIDIVIDHIGENYGAAGEQAEVAYSMITSSFQFIGTDEELR